jgi:Fe2+ transport system protein FeoA
MPLPTKKPTVPANRDDAGVPLSSLAAGCSATVLAVDASTPQTRRLLDLGFLPETDVRVVRRAPLGDPIAFYLRGGQICLRRAEAERIQVYAVRPADEE